MLFDSKRKKISTTVAPEMISDDSLTYSVANLQGLGARRNQEDAFTLANALDKEKYTKQGLMFAVCDGMGGMKGGEIASGTAVQGLRRLFGSLTLSGNIAEQLRDGIFSVSAEIESVLGGDGGSTVVMGIILNERLFFASVGDSFFYLLRDGRLYRLNTPHDLCHELYLSSIRNGGFDVMGSRGDREAGALAQFLGMTGISEADVSENPIPLMKGDVLLACSDGVGGVLDDDELIDALMCFTAAETAENIEKKILSRGLPHQDNYTAVIVKCI